MGDTSSAATLIGGQGMCPDLLAERHWTDGFKHQTNNKKQFTVAFVLIQKEQIIIEILEITAKQINHP
jgi:hypothetical protein